MSAGSWNNEPADRPKADERFTTLRRIALIGGIAQVPCWLLFAFYISCKANPLGDGLEWVAMVPATGILVVLVAPALLFGAINRLLALAAGLVLAAAIFNVLLFVQVAEELAPK